MEQYRKTAPSKRRCRILTAVALSLVLSALPAEAANTFVDDDDSIFERTIEAIAAAGITSGCGDRTFCPDDYVTRGQMAALLTRALDLPASSQDRYVDDDDSIFERNIQAIAAAGITSGCGDRTFCPDDYVTRGQMAALLTRALDLPASSQDRYVDDDDSIFERNIQAIAAVGITRGCGERTFCPDDYVTRGQTAALLTRALNLPVGKDPTPTTSSTAEPAPASPRSPSPSPSPSGAASPTADTSPEPTTGDTHDNKDDPTEGVPVASDADVVIHVDGAHPDASDDGPASATTPLATFAEGLDRAHDANRSALSAHVIIAPGVYRESVRLSSYDATDAPLVIEGRGEVVVSGSEVYGDWQGGSGGVYTHRWVHDWGLSEVPSRWLTSYGAEQLEDNPVIRRREMVFVDGRLMTPHTSYGAMAGDPGSFYVDEAADTLHLHVPDGVDLASATVEVAERDSVLSIGQRTNVTVRGMTLTHAASPVQGRALGVGRSSRVTLEDLRLVWNSWGGLGMAFSQDVVVRRVVADHNGVAGMSGFMLDDVLVEDSSTSHNGWRGVRGVEDIDTDRHVDPTFVDFAGGQKFFSIYRATFRRHTASHNLASGLWFDTHNRDIVVEDSVFDDNLTWGLFFEASDGPLRVAGSRMCGNETGLLIANSEDGSVVGNTIGSNPEGQLWFSGRHERWVSFRDGGGRHLSTQNWTLQENRIGTPRADDALVATRLDGDAWTLLASTLDSDRNTWTSASGTSAWRLARGKHVDFGTWRSETGGDVNSSFANAAPPC